MGKGALRFEIGTANGDLPVAGAKIIISSQTGDVLYQLTSDANGLADAVELEAPDGTLTLRPDYDGDPYARYNVEVRAPGFRPVQVRGVQIFDGESSALPVVMEPLTASGTRSGATIFDIPKNALQDATQRQQETDRPNPRILREVIIPDFITVHLGHPDNDKAMTTRVRFIDYAKNVASSEIYPHWPKAALEANILAQISLALNRVYTEWRCLGGYFPMQ